MTWRRFLLVYVFGLAMALPVGVTVGVAVDASWPFIGVVLALGIVCYSVGAWLGLRAVRARRAPTL